MSAKEYIENLFENAYDIGKMTIEEAQLDIDEARRNAEIDADSDWEILDDLTPETYMGIWNELVEEQEQSTDEYSDWETELIWSGNIVIG